MRRNKHNGKGRVRALLVLCAVVFALFLVRLAWMQFAMAGYYAEKVAEASTTRYSYMVPAARGDILDRNGQVLAQDTPVWDVYLKYPAPPGSSIEAAARQTLDILQLSGGEDVETQLAAFCSSVSAGEYLLASGVSAADTALLYQAGLVESGAVRLSPAGTRTWPDGTLLPHALGTVGAITAEQWAELSGSGVAMDALIGQSGLEAAYEQLLHGTDGRVRVTAGSAGVLTEEVTAEPQPGASLVLALDAGLQRSVQTALENHLAALRATKAAGAGREANAGAVVVVDVATGGILAAANAPSYDLAAYRSGYAALAADPAAPLLDRTAQGLYAPGSAFKPAVAAAALSAGVVTPQDTVACTGRYRFYSGYQPRCLQIGHSGPVDLFRALQYSCNIYFYDVGRRLGADAFADAARTLGLAAPTGIELPEAGGSLTHSTDANFTAGLTLQAAIGQGNTAVTPMQLAAYAAALANDGTRLALHYADRAVDADGRVVWQYQPQVLSRMDGGEEVFGPIRQGMQAMAGTLRALDGAGVSVACKTGSPQRADRLADGSYYTNSVLIAYAPADDPQIAVSIVLEYGGGGANAAPLLRAVLDAWLAGRA